MLGTHLKSLLIAVMSAGLAAVATAQISFGPGGTATLAFDTLPVLADGWSTLSVAGGGNTITSEAALDAAVQTLASSGFTTALGSSGTTPPSANAIARWNSALFLLQSRPTGNSHTLALATLRNDSGGDVATVNIAYDFAVQSPVTLELPGFYVYYSLTGAAGSWTKIPELSGSEVAGPVSVTLTMAGGPWASGANLYILWADDNADTATDPSYTIDNFAVTPSTPQPPMIVTQPASTTVQEGQIAQLSVQASGSGVTYQWYRGTVLSPTLIAGATASALRVTNTMGDSRYAWSNPMDSGTYFVRVSGTAGSPVDSDVVTVTVNPDPTAPAFSYALCGPGTSPEQMTLIVSEALNDAGGEVTDVSNWEIKTLDNLSSLNIASIAYTDNGTSRTITFDLDPMFPRDATKAYKITLTASIRDTAKTPNFLNGPVSTPVLCFTNELLNLTANWRYNDKDVDPVDQAPVSWTDVAYNDSGAPWATGASPFDAKRNAAGLAGQNCRDTALYSLGPVGTCFNLESPVTLTNLITSYHRTHFNYPGSTAGAVLYLNGKFDDGAVVYLNGVEVWRLGMAAGTVTHTTLATRTVNDTDAQDTIILPTPASLVSGDNVIAYSVHQINLTSTDLTAGLAVSRLVAEPPAALPSLTIAAGAGTVTITSTVAGTLISSTDIAAPRASWTNEGAIGAGAPGVTLPTTGTRRFFAVRVP